MASLLALPPDPQVLFLCLLVLVVLVFASAVRLHPSRPRARWHFADAPAPPRLQRLDVPLHLAGWLLFGAHFAGRFHTRILPFIDPLLSPVQVASDVVIDILPGSSSDSWVVLLLSTLLTLAATGMLSGTHSYRGSWLTYVLVRALFPMSMSKESANDIPHILLWVARAAAAAPAHPPLTRLRTSRYSFVTASSLMGPMASWPSRSFAAADAGYAIATDMMRPATEHAVISVLLCFSHDFVARYLLQFLESAAFTVAMVFIGQISLLVASGSSKVRDEAGARARGLTGVPVSRRPGTRGRTCSTRGWRPIFCPTSRCAPRRCSSRPGPWASTSGPSRRAAWASSSLLPRRCWPWPPGWGSRPCPKTLWCVCFLGLLAPTAPPGTGRETRVCRGGVHLGHGPVHGIGAPRQAAPASQRMDSSDGVLRVRAALA
jgi:hypothetical protein